MIQDNDMIILVMPYQLSFLRLEWELSPFTTGSLSKNDNVFIVSSSYIKLKNVIEIGQKCNMHMLIHKYPFNLVEYIIKDGNITSRLPTSNLIVIDKPTDDQLNTFKGLMLL